MKSKTKAIRNAIQECRDELARLPNAFPVYEYLTLCAAQDAGVIGPQWRGQVDIKALEKNYESELTSGGLEKEWGFVLERYVRSVILAAALEPYETESLLRGRDALELLGKVLDSARRSNVREYDEELKSILRKNKNNYRSNRSEPLLEEYLPDHWWWRYDLKK